MAAAKRARGIIRWSEEDETIQKGEEAADKDAAQSRAMRRLRGQAASKPGKPRLAPKKRPPTPKSMTSRRRSFDRPEMQTRATQRDVREADSHYVDSPKLRPPQGRPWRRLARACRQSPLPEPSLPRRKSRIPQRTTQRDDSRSCSQARQIRGGGWGTSSSSNLRKPVETT